MDTRLPLYQRIRDDMLTRIARGEWRPDKPIPTESALTREYDVAIGTVRKAVDTLVGDHLLYRSQGRGTFVRRPGFDASLFRFFRQLDAHGERHIPDSRILSCELAPPSERAQQTLALARQCNAIHLDRERVLESDNRIREDIWLPADPFGALADRPLDTIGNLLYPFYEQTFGIVIASAQETLTIEAADADTADALGVMPGDPIVIIERISRGYDNQPIEYRRSRGRADRFRYQVDIT